MSLTLPHKYSPPFVVVVIIIIFLIRFSSQSITVQVSGAVGVDNNASLFREELLIS